VSGFTLPASDADLNIDVAAGVAVIDAHYVEITTATSVTCTASQTNYIYLKLTKDGGSLVDAATFEVNTSGTPPADSVYIGTAVASGTAVTSTTDQRTLRHFVTHTHEDNANGGTLGKTALETATGSATCQQAAAGGVGATTRASVTMNDMAFSRQVTYYGGLSFTDAGGEDVSAVHTSDPGTQVAMARLYAQDNTNATITTTIRWKYLTASDMPEIWVAQDPISGLVKGVWASDDEMGFNPIEIDGCVSVQLKANDLRFLGISAEAMREAESMITEKGLRPQHHLYRALQIMSNDPAPARWVQANCTIEGSRLVVKR